MDIYGIKLIKSKLVIINLKTSTGTINFEAGPL